MALQSWYRNIDEFAKRIEVSNIKGFFKKDIVVEIGTNALFLQDGKLTGTLEPGSYTVGGALKRLKECRLSDAATIILVDRGDVRLKIEVSDLLTKERVKTGANGNITVELTAPEMFLVNFMKSSNIIKIRDLEEFLEGELKQVLQSKIKNISVFDLYGDLELKKELEQDFEHLLRTTLERIGLRLIQLNYIGYLEDEMVKEVLKVQGEAYLEQKKLEAEKKLRELQKEQKLGEIEYNALIKEAELQAKKRLEDLEKNLNIPVLRIKIDDKDYQFKQDLIKIGRNPDNDIVISAYDTLASREHAQILFENQKWYILDVGSTNGTYVNGTKITTKTKMQDSDQIQVGNTIIYIELDNKEALSTPSKTQYFRASISIPKIRIGSTEYFLKKSVMNIGRNTITNDICIPDIYASRKHARILLQEDGYYIEDIGSKNGSYINGRQITEKTKLHDGDIINVGRTQLQFIL